MKISAWKILGIVLLLYAFVVGLYIPLKPGILNVDPNVAQSGTRLTLNIEGYNTSFLKVDSINCWLKFDSIHFVKANHIDKKTNVNLIAEFLIPNQLPDSTATNPTTLLIEDKLHGTILRPDAVFITKDTAQTSASDSISWAKIPTHFAKISYKTFPFRNILEESIRNTYFHVPLWFAMIVLFGIACYYHVIFLRKGDLILDEKSTSFIQTGLIFGILGLLTGAVWAKYTWGAYWSGDVKQDMTAICLLIYLAYFVLRASFDDEWKKARLSAVYGIFAFVSVFPLLFVIPRMKDSLHPGNGGNPALGSGDLDNTMRMVFYPSVIGFIILGIWISTLIYRYVRLKNIILERKQK